VRRRRYVSTVVSAIAFIGICLSGRFTSGEPTAPVGSPQSPVLSALEQYQSGEFDLAVSRLLSGRTVGAVRGSFQRDAGRWIDQAEPRQRVRRVSVVAAVSVELMAASFRQHWAQYEEARQILEWACSGIRKLDPSEFELWFHLAGMALMQGAGDEALLSGSPDYLSLSYVPGGESHPKHAGLRFPHEARFKLAYITTRLEAHALATWPLPLAYLTAKMPGRFFLERAGDADQIDDTLRNLSALFGEPAVQSEARLRSGALRLLLGQPNDAKPHLSLAATADDQVVRYLAHLLLGAIEDHADRLAYAVQHYRDAYDIVPATVSSVALASALYRTGAEVEAAEILEKYDQHDPVADPWRSYAQRDYRFLPQYLAKLRQTLIALP
jgi:hypothetical protein